MIAGIATINPAAVVKRASEIPFASRVGSPTDPNLPKTPNADMFPVTVPSKPRSGAIWVIVPSVGRFFRAWVSQDWPHP